MSEDWTYSTEGDLDPDLTEEAGYVPWEPPTRSWIFTAARIGMTFALIAIVGGTLLVVL